MTNNIKPDVNIHPKDWDIRYFCHTAILDGTIACLVKHGPGAFAHPIAGNLDDPGAEVGPPVGTLSNTIPIGLTMQEMIEFDDTRFVMDKTRFDLAMVGGKLGLLHSGGFTLRTIADPPTTPLGSRQAYYDENGFLTTVDTGSPIVGRFMSERDADGYAYVYLNIGTFHNPGDTRINAAAIAP